MDLRVAFVIVCLCALAITSTEAGIPKCCVRTRNINKHILMKVERLYEQRSNGACDISALILYIKGSKKPIYGMKNLFPIYLCVTFSKAGVFKRLCHTEDLLVVFFHRLCGGHCSVLHVAGFILYFVIRNIVM
uniref:Chemokine interleukin-8-like domain-containing protein n=1 Tax=Seriola dumerili TaxID=41447 RepID=A0A3B4TB62_SERDU